MKESKKIYIKPEIKGIYYVGDSFMEGEGLSFTQPGDDEPEFETKYDDGMTGDGETW